MSSWWFVVLAPMALFLYLCVGHIACTLIDDGDDEVAITLCWPVLLVCAIPMAMYAGARTVTHWRPTKRVNLPQAKVVSK